MLGVPFTLIGGLAALIYVNNKARQRASDEPSDEDV
jgi:hypothetical protein